MHSSLSKAVVAEMAFAELAPAGPVRTAPVPVVRPRRRLTLYPAVKRATDVLLAAAMLAALAPLMGVIALLIAIDGGSVLYRHRRSGRDGQDFDCLKFRTMITDAQECFDEYLAHHPEVRGEWEADRKLRFDPRITAVGRFLRASSLDELPQLLNVIRGDMSLVGPRPVTDEELPRYGDRLPLYQSVRPGLTGLWQVSGRNDVDFQARVALDERYVLTLNPLADLRILLRTPAVVLKRSGAR
jgi:exopolysaccharide production protein ExoY